MIMKDKTLCKTCIYGEVSAGSYFCNRCYDENGKFYPRRIAKRTENFCYDYIEKGQNKMDIIKEEIQKPETTTVMEKPQKRIWTDDDCKTLIEFYNKNTEYSVLAEMFSVSKKQIAQKVFNLKNSEKWKNCFTDSGTISETEIVAEAEAPAEPVTTLEEVRETSLIKDHINDLKVYFADFVIDECKREVVPEAVEFIGAYLKYLESRVNGNGQT